MPKTILITGATDGIGLETAKLLVAQGHTVLLHGRNAAKLDTIQNQLAALSGAGHVESYRADLSRLADVESLAQSVAANHTTLDVLINNAGVLKTADTVTADGLDVRFMVNAIAPYQLSQRLLPLLPTSGRIVNVASAAQAPVSLDALMGRLQLTDDMTAYAQSKLALIMWSRHLASLRQDDGPVVVAVNPGSLLGSKMVKEGFGIAGKDLQIGANVLMRAAIADEFATASGQYFDNDSGRFAAPHADALNGQKVQTIADAIAAIVDSSTSSGKVDG